MRFEFKLPDIGEGVVEGEIVQWLVAEGDAVQEDQPLVEVMTDKATVEIPAPQSGTIIETQGEIGETVAVGSVLLVIDTDAVSTPDQPPAAAMAPTVEAEGPVQPVEAPQPHPLAGAQALAGPRKVLAAPATRRLARELGIDVAAVAGTGARGRVTQADVVAASCRECGAAATPRRGDARAVDAPPAQPVAAKPEESLAGSPPPAAGIPMPVDGAPLEQRTPFVGLRKRIAMKMAESTRTAAHFTYVDEVDMSELVALRMRLKAAAEARDAKLSYLPFVVKALERAFALFPTMNSTLDEARNELVVKRSYHIGIAVDTAKGLFVPVVKGVERKSLLQIAAEIAQLAQLCREGKATREQLTGSTFTITSVGNIGGMFATPIINFPEVAILGINRIHDRPVVRDGEIVIRKMMYLALSFDHRIIDGAVGAGFCNEIKRYLESPGLLMLDMA